MSDFLVAGLLHMETIVKVDKIPVEFNSLTSRHDTIFTSIGGDAYNMALALKWLGNNTDLMAMVDEKIGPGIINSNTESEIKLSSEYILPRLKAMPSAVTLYDENKRQQIFEDTKDLRNTQYDIELFEKRIETADAVVMSNLQFCKPLIDMALERHIPIAVNIRDFRKEDLNFNSKFLDAADIIYVSDDNLVKDSYEFVKEIAELYSPEIIILGQGAKGVLIYSSKENIFAEYKSVKTLEIVNTVGAGNALFSCFLHYYLKDGNAVAAIKNALLFASYKIGFVGTSNGFMTEEQINHWRNIIWNI
ncbi:MAG: carbohydrate kinase family protein [Lachnospiraceae bacterium]|nr:carbohydrate kinase family protein [Lachnospiraceae bacterium]MDE5781471.1 carbohydrate kinase family protein [Lachnospiraceae bacterium]MDE6253818.1 carbohydrate kinase family protein [Lachnospiraceae bacterium]